MKKLGGNIYQIETSKKSARKYPNVIWFPRSKTDPREIREVLKLALMAQEANPEGFFNDKILGEKMARIGSINVLGLGGDKYIESYEGKSTGNFSYIKNARMLMRLFRFLGLVTRLNKGRYVITELGRLYCTFSGDFPSYEGKMSEEKVLLDMLAGFSFYSVNDDSTYRDSKFRIRPFYSLLYCLSLEPQCIYQLIVTAFASRDESSHETDRITALLKNLRSGKTNLKTEWQKLGLEPDDYSCVHNFYDSAKILVYLGASLGLIEKIPDPVYGKKISGKARHLKQATIFYCLSEKGRGWVEENKGKKLLYYDKLYEHFGDDSIIDAVFLLATLNYRLGNKKVASISKEFYAATKDIGHLMNELKSRFGIEIKTDGEELSLTTPITFSFYQSMPPEILNTETMKKLYDAFIKDFNNKNSMTLIEADHSPAAGSSDYKPYFALDDSRRYTVAKHTSLESIARAIKYDGKDNIYGGSDRFSSRVSPTNSILLQDNVLLVNNSTDALDLLVPLRLADSTLTEFIEANTLDLIKSFVARSDTWEKDQHYTWVRNCFRHLGMEAVYSGSSGMLSRADVSITAPFIGGIEAKSPRENRGTINLKAIRQAVDAKIQVADRLDGAKEIPSVGMAIGRRISELAIREERKWAKQNQPVLLINDAILHYLVIKSASTSFSEKSLVNFFTQNNGLMSQDAVLALFKENTNNKVYLEKVESELAALAKYFATED